MSENLAEKIAFQKQAVSLLKKEIFGTDRKPRSKYIREFIEEFRTFDEVSSYEALLREARQRRVIYVGDYHALPQSQQFQVKLLHDLANQPISLAIEMLYGRDQRALDAWMAGEIDDERFLRRTRFHLEWGYSWDNYRPILQVARENKIPVHAIDCDPRTDLRLIRKRDKAVARKIGEVLRRNPDRQLVVSFGESHLATRHLPEAVLSYCTDDPPSSFLVLQNIEEIYWQAAGRGFESEFVVRTGDGAYCVFNATPFEKTEAYRRQLEIWKAHDQDEQALDLTSTVYNLIDTILAFAGIDKYTHCLEGVDTSLELLVDAYPEVYSHNELQDFRALLEGTHLTNGQFSQILDHTTRLGSCYVPRMNAIYLGRLDLVHGAEEASHFVNFALKGQRYKGYRALPMNRADQFYLTALEESLGYFGSKLIDPRRNHRAESAVLNCEAAAGAVARRLGTTPKQLLRMREFIRAHKAMERDYAIRNEIPAIVVDGLRSRGKAFTVLSHDLGYILGEDLYRGYLNGVFSRKEISRLFQTRFEESGSVFACYLDLATRAN